MNQGETDSRTAPPHVAALHFTGVAFTSVIPSLCIRSARHMRIDNIVSLCQTQTA
ncbi:hypothetical protein B0H12DRAFT_1139048 [Mycena haematopus]|nr:hypothetical protein B0H12DRAFT_1139048 [Mycena haematopus]